MTSGISDRNARTNHRVIADLAFDLVISRNAYFPKNPKSCAPWPKSEEDIIKERLVTKLTDTRCKGKGRGRPPGVEELYENAKEPLQQGLPFHKIIRELNNDQGKIRNRRERI
jgi:hypothetical protein